jgi:hypothetical protein
MRIGSLPVVTSLLLACLLMSTGLAGQSTTTGEVTGLVTDASHAVVPHVVVTLKSIENGFTQMSTTGALGVYRFPLVAPGKYSLSTTVRGFVPTSRKITVDVGQIISVDVKLQVGATETTIEVTSEAPLLQTENADSSTTFNAQQVADIPNPGNDLTYVAQTAPGAVMNTQGGVGNFSIYGLPSTSNLFTLDGMYDNDPDLNMQNSGATNLVLGSNEIQEVTVVNNGYSGEYGGFAGAHVNYISKSGSNDFHGNAAYWWNGRAMNANNWFHKDVPPGTPVTPRPFDNANQYAASVGGPIKRDKAFFYFDYEGIRFVLPISNLTLIPSPQFEMATLANLRAPETNLSVSVPFYQQMFNLWNHAPGAERAVPGIPQTGDPTGCNGFTGLGPNVPCALSFRSIAGNFTKEDLLSGRFDFNLSSHDRLFFRLREDNGLQASYTDPISPIFNSQSAQPIYQGQISENHFFSTRAANQFIISTLFASFVNHPKDLSAALAAFPATLCFGDGSFTCMGGMNAFVPSGHSFTVYQVLDDFSLAVGSRHNLKFGLSFTRHDVSDHDYGFFAAGQETVSDLADFFVGGNGPSGDLLTQNFPRSLAQSFASYGLGFYLQDDWQITRNLTLTLSVRADHNSNPVCQQDCNARLALPFSALNHDVNIPYNQAIRIGLHNSLPSFTSVVWQPRLGFAWTPLWLKNTVFRGGVGLFMDTLPVVFAAGFSSNPPLVDSFTVSNNNLAPAEPSNLFKDAANSNAAFVSGFSSGGTLASIIASAEAANLSFTPPGITTAVGIKAPRFQEWNLQIQHGFSANTAVTVNYVGNHGIFIPVGFSGINAFCPPLTSSHQRACLAGFTGLPASAPDPRFSGVTELRSGADSNYNGVVASFHHRFQKGFLVQANFAWSHALDEISNGGNVIFNAGSAFSLQSPEDNHNLRKYNYGNADYDTRHYFSASYLWELPYKFGPMVMLKGWQVSGTVFNRSGFPYTVIDSGTTNLLSGFGYGGVVFANVLATSFPRCSSPKHPCLAESQFSSPLAQTPASYGLQRRNQFYGPGYFNTDFTVIKDTAIPGWERGRLGVGVQFFNLFNHPNFDQPNRDINDPSTFGHITGTVRPPTSIVGALGGNTSPRMIQLTARLNF